MRILIPILATLPLLAACQAGGDDRDAPIVAERVAGTAAPTTPPDAFQGTFMPYGPGVNAITYDPAVVPPGANAQVAISRTAQGTTVRLAVNGMVPRRAYGAHLHTDPCAAVPDQSGPHYQHHRPPSPGTDPAYANPDNEVWLDFVADTRGAATATATQDWVIDETNPPRSLVVHAMPTRTGGGLAGTAGARVACLTLPPG